MRHDSVSTSSFSANILVYSFILFIGIMLFKYSFLSTVFIAVLNAILRQSFEFLILLICI